MAREMVALLSAKQPWLMRRIKSHLQNKSCNSPDVEDINKEKYVIKNPFYVYIYMKTCKIYKIDNEILVLVCFEYIGYDPVLGICD